MLDEKTTFWRYQISSLRDRRERWEGEGTKKVVGRKLICTLPPDLAIRIFEDAIDCQLKYKLSMEHEKQKGLRCVIHSPFQAHINNVTD